MARNFLTPINLNGLELQGAAIGNLSTTSINAITSGTGRIQYDSTLNVLKYRDNTGWQTISTGGGSFTLGSTSISLGSTTTTVAGLSSVTSTTFVGALTGNASTATSWATARNLAGNSVDGSANVAFANKFIVQGTTDSGLSGAQFLGALGTGILKNTTTTGVLSIASAGDFPTLNQNTTGSAGSTTGTLTFGTGLTAGGASFNGSANVTITPVSATTLVAGIVQLSDSTSTTGSTKAATETAVKAAYDRGSTGVTNAATAQSTADAALPKAGGTMTGAIAMGNNKITGLGTPTAAADAATKDYVDNVSAGINIHEAVVAATTGTISGTYAAGSTTANPPGDGGTGVGATITYAATGTTTLDTSVTLALYDRVLVKDGVTTGAAGTTSSIANGVYVVTTAGTTGVATVLTRATDADNSIFGDLSAGDLVYVIGGNTYGGDQFVQTTKGTATSGTGAGTVYSVKIGTDAVSYTQFSGAGSVPAATTSSLGIASFDSAQFSVTTGAVTINNLAASVVTTGQLTGARGGTGVDNTGKTITLGGNLTTSGANALTLTTSGATNVTLPTSGTLMTTSGNTTGSAATLTTSRTLWGQSFNGSANVTGAITGATTITGTSATAFTVQGADYASTSGQATATYIRGSYATAATGTAQGGNLYLWAGGSDSGSGTAGVVDIQGSSTTVTGTVKLPSVQSGSAGFVKIAATTGQLSTASIAYSDLPTNVGVVARKVSQVGTGSGTTIALTHGLGTNLVTAQVYDTSTSTATLVETDITVTSTTATATFAATTTLSNYTLVVVG